MPRNPRVGFQFLAAAAALALVAGCGFGSIGCRIPGPRFRSATAVRLMSSASASNEKRKIAYPAAARRSRPGGAQIISMARSWARLPATMQVPFERLLGGAKGRAMLLLQETGSSRRDSGSSPRMAKSPHGKTVRRTPA